MQWQSVMTKTPLWNSNMKLLRYCLVLMKSQLLLVSKLIFNRNMSLPDKMFCSIQLYWKPSWACWIRSSKATNALSFCRIEGCLLSLNHRGETPSNILPSAFRSTLRKLWTYGELSVWCQQSGRSLKLRFGCGLSGRYVSCHYLQILAPGASVTSWLNFAVWHWCYFWQSSVMHLNREGLAPHSGRRKEGGVGWGEVRWGDRNVCSNRQGC